MLYWIVFSMGVGRIILGLAPFVAAGATSRLMGFPAAHDTPTARLMARLFGVRDIGLGVLVFWALRTGGPALPFAIVFNALTDFGDLFATSIPIVRRQGIDRAALTSLGFALTAGVGWLVVYSQLA
ncbi:MAG: DUF4267 domain-containing protein [Polyangiaceae bacterium]